MKHGLVKQVNQQRRSGVKPAHSTCTMDGAVATLHAIFMLSLCPDIGPGVVLSHWLFGRAAYCGMLWQK